MGSMGVLDSDQGILRELGRRIRAQRIVASKTQGELAQEAGVSRGALERLENGEGSTLGSFVRIVRLLGHSGNLDLLIPDQSDSPVEEMFGKGGERKRYRRRTQSQAGGGVL